MVDEVRRLLEDPDYRRQTVEHNYDVASHFFSYGVARKKLEVLITNVMGD